MYSSYSNTFHKAHIHALNFDGTQHSRSYMYCTSLGYDRLLTEVSKWGQISDTVQAIILISTSCCTFPLYSMSKIIVTTSCFKVLGVTSLRLDRGSTAAQRGFSTSRLKDDHLFPSRFHYSMALVHAFTLLPRPKCSSVGWPKQNNASFNMI